MAEWTKAENMTVRKMVDLPPVWLMGFIALVWAQVWIWPAATWDHGAARLLGGMLFWGGIALILWAILAFRSHRTSVVPHQTPQHLITSGPFAISRNPIYLADLMILSGVVLGQGAYLMLFLVPVLHVILARRFIAPEEGGMKESFGAEFATYLHKTRRWL